MDTNLMQNFFGKKKKKEEICGNSDRSLSQGLKKRKLSH